MVLDIYETCILLTYIKDWWNGLEHSKNDTAQTTIWIVAYIEEFLSNLRGQRSGSHTTGRLVKTNQMHKYPKIKEEKTRWSMYMSETEQHRVCCITTVIAKLQANY